MFSNVLLNKHYIRHKMFILCLTSFTLKHIKSSVPVYTKLCVLLSYVNRNYTGARIICLLYYPHNLIVWKPIPFYNIYWRAFSNGKPQSQPLKYILKIFQHIMMLQPYLDRGYKMPYEIAQYKYKEVCIGAPVYETVRSSLDYVNCL